MAATLMPQGPQSKALLLTTFVVKGHPGTDALSYRKAWSWKEGEEAPLLSTSFSGPMTCSSYVSATAASQFPVLDFVPSAIERERLTLPPMFPLLSSDDFEDSPRDQVIAQLERDLEQQQRKHERQGSKNTHRNHDDCAIAGASRSLAPTMVGGIGGGGDGTGSTQHVEWQDDDTTVMIRNVPNRYTVEELFNEMRSKGFENTSHFDFLYLPIDFNTKRNRSYGFVNFRSIEVRKDFFAMFHNHRLSRYSTKKVLEVHRAETQGYKANVAKFVRKDSQRVQNRWFKPMLFGQEEEENCHVGATAIGNPVDAAQVL